MKKQQNIHEHRDNEKNDLHCRLRLRILRFVVITTICAFLLYFAFLTKQYLVAAQRPTAKNDKKQVPLVLVTAVKETAQKIKIIAYGRVESHHQEIHSPVGGKIQEFHKRFYPGTFVKRNEVLLQIDTREYERNVELYENEIQKIQLEILSWKKESQSVHKKLLLTKKSVAAAKEGLRKAKLLARQGGISELELYKAEINYQDVQLQLVDLEREQQTFPEKVNIAKVQLKNTRIKLRKAQEQQQQTSIRAPFDARIKTIGNNGTYVAMNEVIATLEDINFVDIRVVVPISDLHKLSTGSFANIVDGKFDIEAMVQSCDNEYNWQGRVVRFEPVVKETLSVPIIVRVENPWRITTQPPLQPGSFVTVTLVGKEQRNVYVISREWLREEHTIHVVRNQQLVIVPISIVHRIAHNDRLVVKGLNHNDHVIILPVSFPVPGMSLQVKVIDNETD